MITASGRQVWGRIYSGLVVAVMCLVPWHAMAAAISHGYQGDSNLVAGSLVAQSKDDKNRVVAANNERSDSLIGVVVSEHSSALEIANAKDEIQVASSGKTIALVSDLSGPIKAGDLIAASPIEGVGMKAVTEGKCIGVAQADASEKGTKTTTITSKDGSKRTVQISLIPVVLEVAYFVPPTENIPYPQFMQKIADTLAGKPVSIIRVIIASGLLLVALGLVGFIIFSGIRSGLTAVGRNPLAKDHILRALVRILATGLVILLVAGGASYLVISG